MKKYLVIGCFVGECCTSPHLYIEKVNAPTPSKAQQFLKAIMERKGYDAGEIAVYHNGKQVTWSQAI